MTPTLYVASGIVILSSVGFVVIGTVYKWDLAAPGYARWTQVIGVLAVLALSAVAAWDMIDQPVLALGIMVVGAALSAGFVVLHRRLSARVREILTARDEGE